MTKKDALQFAIDVVSHVPSDRQTEVVEVLQKMIDQLFEEQVASYFETQLTPGIAVAYAR